MLLSLGRWSPGVWSLGRSLWLLFSDLQVKNLKVDDVKLDFSFGHLRLNQCDLVDALGR